jgi:hypothetical protein
MTQTRRRSRTGRFWQAGFPVLLLVFFLAGCNSGAQSNRATSEAAPGKASDGAASRSTAGEEPPQVADARRRIDPLLLALLWGTEEEVLEALDAIGATEDAAYAAPLVDLIHSTFLGIYGTVDPEHYVGALSRITGESFGLDWPEWVRWVGRENPGVPKGYLEWKGRLWSHIDPDFYDFLSGETAIRPEEILWGGVASDGIPTLVDSPTVGPEEAGWLAPEDLVFGVAINGEARAYPLRILDWHEMANDTVGGVPVALSYCTLCGAAILYDRRIDDTEYLFRTSGLLYRSNKLMYDTATRSLWNQFTGRPVVGTLVGEEIRLRQLPLVLAGWAEWRKEHPETTVLSRETGHDRNYGAGAAYGHYFSSPDAMFPLWGQSDVLPEKAIVYGIEIDGVAKAYPIEQLESQTAVRDFVGGAEVLLVVGDAGLAVEGLDFRGDQVGYLSGAQIRAYRLPAATPPGPFSRSDGRVVGPGGARWSLSEEILVSPEGLEAPRIAGNLSFWFAWSSFYPQTELFGQGIEGR